MLRRAFALVFDVVLLLLLHIMISTPLWSLAPDHLAFPIDIAETEFLDEQTTAYHTATITTRRQALHDLLTSTVVVEQ